MSTNGQFNGGNNQNGSNSNHLHHENNAITNAVNSHIQSPNFNQSSNHKTQYHKKALDEIRISLQPFMNNERPTSSDDASSTSETSSNNFRNNYVDLYHHSTNYHSTNSNATNKYQLTSPPPISLMIPDSDGLDYYKNGLYTPMNAACLDKQSPTSTSLNSTLNSNSDFMQLKHHHLNNNGKLLITPGEQQQFATANGASSQFCSKISSNLAQQLPQQMPQHIVNEMHSQMPINNNVAKLQAWSVRQTKSQSPVIMQSVKSTQVQKPILQTACAPIVNQQQMNVINTTTSTQQQTRQQYQLNENNLKTDLVQLNPNITKQFINKMISLENSNSVYQKQQMPLPEPQIKSPQSPAYSLISDKSNNSNLTNCLEQYAIRTSSALSNCSNSSKMTSYSTTSSIATNASSIHNSNFNHPHLPNQPPPPYVPYSAKSTNVLNKPQQQQFNLVNSNSNNSNQIVHIAKPVTINQTNSNNDQLIGGQVNQIDSRPPPPYQPPIQETTTTSTTMFLGSVNRHFNMDKLQANTPPATVPEPPSYATSVLLKQQQLNSKQNKINRPLPPLPDEAQQPSNQLKSFKPPIQPGPPLPPKPTKLATQPQVQSPDLNNQLLFNDELDSHNATSFNASSNLQLLQKQLEEHLQLNRPLVEKLKQIQLQKHQQKVLHNLKQQNQQQAPSLPAKTIVTNNTQQATNVKPTISSMKRPQPAPPLLPKKDKLLNNKPKPLPVNAALNTVVPLAQQPQQQQQNHAQQKTTQNKKPNEYENTIPKNEANNELISDDQQSNASSCQEPEQESRITHHSPIPQRKLFSKEYELERRETKVKNYSAAAYKFFMEQHIENVIKSRQQRENRKKQLEKEMIKANLASDAQLQMRKMLQQKESNYIRLRRAKMDKSMFEHIKTLGRGAFGQVSLVRKTDTNQLYAMKTLLKTDILKRNQFAHVKAERDILAEADNEWVVKLWYSFQDAINLYFVMDYIPGGDLMNLLIKMSIFPEPIAQFYIGELVLAVESVHKMKFIHRDIKPDNILIDRDGHIKLSDFGLCTGFRWTHDSKYYQCSGYETVELGLSCYQGDLAEIGEDFEAFNDFGEINERNQEKLNNQLDQFSTANYEVQKHESSAFNSNSTQQPETNALPLNDEIVKKCDKCLKRIQMFDLCDKCKQPTGDKKEGNCFECIKLRNQLIMNIKICNNCNKPLERRRRRQNLRNQAHSLVGTPNYIAPEVLQKTQKGYSQACDWWSVGIILYEMLVGSAPFNSDKIEETQFKIINWREFLHIPKEAEVSEHATDLILKLCTSAENRLGNNGTDDIKNHPFFQGFDFTSEIRKTTAPLRPQISHPTDTSNFENYNTMTLQCDELEDYYEYQERNLNNYENNDYMANSDDECSAAQRTDNGAHKRRSKDRKLPEHAFFEFTFRRFFDEGGGALPHFSNVANIGNKFNNLDINNLDINLDGTLKLGSLKSNRELNLEQNVDDQKEDQEKMDVAAKGGLEGGLEGISQGASKGSLKGVSQGASQVYV